MAVMLFTLALGGFGLCQSAKTDLGAEKAVLAYAQVYAYGSTPYAKEAGFSNDDMSEMQKLIYNRLRDSFKQFCLSDESLQKITDTYLNKMESSMEITTKLKVADAKNPIVTLTAKVLDEESFEKQATNNQNIQGLAFGIMGMQQINGKTEADLKADSEIQKALQEGINNFIAGLDFGQAKSIDFTCEKIKDTDGKTYWVPQDTKTLYEFLTITK